MWHRQRNNIQQGQKFKFWTTTSLRCCSFPTLHWTPLGSWETKGKSTTLVTSRHAQTSANEFRVGHPYSSYLYSLQIQMLYMEICTFRTFFCENHPQISRAASRICRQRQTSKHLQTYHLWPRHKSFRGKSNWSTLHSCFKSFNTGKQQRLQLSYILHRRWTYTWKSNSNKLQNQHRHSFC